MTPGKTEDKPQPQPAPPPRVFHPPTRPGARPRARLPPGRPARPLPPATARPTRRARRRPWPPPRPHPPRPHPLPPELPAPASRRPPSRPGGSSLSPPPPPRCRRRRPRPPRPAPRHPAVARRLRPPAARRTKTETHPPGGPRPGWCGAGGPGGGGGRRNKGGSHRHLRAGAGLRPPPLQTRPRWRGRPASPPGRQGLSTRWRGRVGGRVAVVGPFRAARKGERERGAEMRGRKEMRGEEGAPPLTRAWGEKILRIATRLPRPAPRQ